MKIPFFAILLLFSLSCAEKNDSKKEEIQDAVKTEETVIKEEQRLTLFQGFPEGIDGCTCFFGNDSNSVRAEDFLFVSTYDSIGYISLNNQIIQLPIINSNRSISEMGDTDHEATYGNDSIRIDISWRYQNRTGYESWWNNGEMEVFLNEEFLESKTFVGECGC